MRLLQSFGVVFVLMALCNTYGACVAARHPTRIPPPVPNPTRSQRTRGRPCHRPLSLSLCMQHRQLQDLRLLSVQHELVQVRLA